MIQQYLRTRWGTAIPVTPQKSTNPPFDYSSKIKFGDTEYQNFSTYYIRVREADTVFDNEMVQNAGCFQMKTAVNIDLTARRLKYGEHFDELNNMRLETIRILGNYRPDDISGIYFIELERPGERDIETQRFEQSGKLPRTIWYLRITIQVHYIKAYACL